MGECIRMAKCFRGPIEIKDYKFELMPMGTFELKDVEFRKLDKREAILLGG